MKYFKKIEGERIYLSPISMDDYEIYTKWMNSSDVTFPLGNISSVYSVDMERQALDRLSKSEKDCNFSIILKDGDELLGNVSLFSINHVHQEATMGIFIGNKERRNKGYGREAIELILEFGFYQLNLHNIMLQVFDFNTNAIALYESIGFTQFGKRHEVYYADGKRHDQCHMEILKKDFIKKRNNK